MATKSAKQNPTARIGRFLGEFFSFNNSLKLYHWHVSGKGSYDRHIAIDQALEDLRDVLDRLVETSYAIYGTLEITVPESAAPDNIVSFTEDFYNRVDDIRDLFQESFSTAILDDCQEAVQQLLYRLKRLQ